MSETVETAGAIIMGADYRGLAIARSLGRHRIPVWVATDSDHSLAAASRYVQRTLRPPSSNSSQRLQYFLKLSEAHSLGNWLLFPTDDEAVSFVARHRQEFSSAFKITTPDWESIKWACNKCLMHCVASNLGLAQPWTFCPKSRGDVEALSCPFPSILKPALKDELNALTIAKAWRVDNHQQLLEAYDQASALMPPSLLMIQEMIPGGGENQFSYTALCCEGEPLVSLTARRTRQYPSDFGRASTYVETVDRTELVEPSVRLLRALKIHGLVEIEYKRDPRDGAFKLLDVNPRVWGWQSLCGRAGVDYPYLLWLLVNNRPLPTVKPIIGVRWVRLSTDLPNALRDTIRSRSNPVAYLRTFIGGSVEEAVFALDDWWPALLELPLIFRAAGRRLLGKRLI